MRGAVTSTSRIRSPVTGRSISSSSRASSRTSRSTGSINDHARFLDRLGSFARLIRFDKRGTGLSDRGVGLPDLETRMDDVRAVMDSVRSEQAALFGYSEGGPMSALFAATYPARTRALVLYGTYAKRSHPDGYYPWAPTWEERVETAADLERTWGENVSLDTMRSSVQVPPRIHLDLYADDQTAEVERLKTLGATEIDWPKKPADADFVIMADPEGNRFCVIDSAGWPGFEGRSAKASSDT